MTQWNIPREVIESENDTAKLRTHISTLESELQQVREERDGMREAMEPAFVILEGLRLSVKWELAPDIVQEIERVCPLVMAALAPSPAARTETEC